MVYQLEIDMLTRNERIIVEAIRNAPTVEIVIPGYDGVTGTTRITVNSKKVCHDVALAVQSHFVNQVKPMDAGAPDRGFRNRECYGKNYQYRRVK